LVGKPEGKGPLGRHSRCKWEDNVKMNVLTEDFHGFPQPLQADALIVPYIRPEPLPSIHIFSNSSFINHHIIKCYIV
jgi:hypothetical protein